MDRKEKHDKGQAIVIMMFGIVAMAALVGLAIDGGRLYTLRRQVQNAADAAAVAGARELAVMISRCDGGSTANNYAVGQAVADFAALNGVVEGTPDGDVYGEYVNKDGNLLAPVGQAGGTIPNGATGVYARLVATDTSTFMRLFGIRHLVAPGEAIAMAGPVTAVNGGILPIGVPEEVISALDPGEPFTILDSHSAFCRDDVPESCIGYDEETETIASSAERGWLNLSYIFNDEHYAAPRPPRRTFKGNFNTNPCSRHGDGSVDVAGTGLKGWTDPSCLYPHQVVAGAYAGLNGDFIVGKTGVAASGFNPLAGYIGQTAYIPVFDYIYNREYMLNAFPGKEDPDEAFPGGTHRYYHIVGFAAVNITDLSGNDVDGYFETAVIGDGAIVPSAGIGNTSCVTAQLVGVKLWK